MERSLLKSSIDEWQETFRGQRGKLIPRAIVPRPPGKDMALALTGLRRSGKTTVAMQLSRDLSEEEVFYYNFEDPLFYTDNKVENLALLLSVAQEYRPSPIRRLILDEIQLVTGWERWLRKLIDQKKYEIIITGSSSTLLSSELASSLTGRALEFCVWPLSLTEVLQFTGTQPQGRADYLAVIRELLTFGSLPLVVKAGDVGEKKGILRQYLGDIVLNDVISRHQIRNKRALDQILTYYLTNISSLHSYSAIGKAFNFDTVTAAEYSRMLSEAFLIHEVPRYHHNLKVQARDPRKVYTGDLGFRAVGARSVNDDSGKLLENLVFLELKRRNKEIFYYQQVQEVDFITVEHYQPTAAIQVCYEGLSNRDTWAREADSLVQALVSLDLRSGLIITFDTEDRIVQNDKVIDVVPVAKWLETGE